MIFTGPPVQRKSDEDKGSQLVIIIILGHSEQFVWLYFQDYS